MGINSYDDRQSLGSSQGGTFAQFPFSVLIGPITGSLDGKNRSYVVFGQGTLDFDTLGAPGLSLTAGLRHT